MTELWFDDVDGIRTLFTDEEYLRVIRPDEMKFCDCPVFATGTGQQRTPVG